MSVLDTSPNIAPTIAGADDLYQKLIDAHAGLSDADSMKLNAKLILILANHIGDQAIVEQAIALARASSDMKDTPQ